MVTFIICRFRLFNKFKLALNSRDYQEGVIVEFAKESRFSPAQFAKIILEEYYKTCSGFDSEGYIFTPETEGVEETVSKELKVKISLWRAKPNQIITMAYHGSKTVSLSAVISWNAKRCKISFFH